MDYAYLDTNVILRFILQDHEVLSNRANNLFSSQSLTLLVTDVVLAELYYVLRGMGYKNRSVSEAMYGLLEQANVIFDQESRLDMLFTIIAETTLDFADCYLVARAILSGSSLATLDKLMLKAYNRYKIMV